MMRYWFSIKRENKSDSEACWSRASGTSAQIPARFFTHRSQRNTPKATSEPVMERVGCSSSRHKTNQPSAIIQCPTASPARALGHTAQPVTNEAATIRVHGRYQGNQANLIFLQRADLWKWMTTLFDDMTNENIGTATEHSVVLKLRLYSNFLHFCIRRHNESKRRLKNVSLPSVFSWGGGELHVHQRFDDWVGARVCEWGRPTLAWAAGILHVRKLMRLFWCKTQFKPHNSWRFDNEAAWALVPVLSSVIHAFVLGHFYFNSPLAVFLPLNVKVLLGFMVDKWAQKGPLMETWLYPAECCHLYDSKVWTRRSRTWQMQVDSQSICVL